MKVLHLASWYPNRKGPQDGDFIQRQLQALGRFNHVRVIAVIKDEHLKPGSSISENALTGNVHETLGYYNPLKSGIKKLDSIFSIFAYQKTFKKLVAQHIRVHGTPDLVHVHVAFRAGLIARWIERKYGIAYIVSEHWSGYKKEDKSGFYFQQPAVQSMIKKILNGAKAILPVSSSLANDIKKITNNQKYFVVPNVVDESLFSPTVEKPSKKFRFLHISTMGAEKQPFMLFKAFDALVQNHDTYQESVELVCLGTVPHGLRQWLNHNIKSKAQILFRGNVPYAQVAEEMRNAHCLVINSIYETFSCVAVEALLSGLPVISTPVGVIPELVTNENGLIVKNEDELLAAMKQMIATRNAFRPHIIASGQKGRFNYQTIGAKLVELYNNL